MSELLTIRSRARTSGDANDYQVDFPAIRNVTGLRLIATQTGPLVPQTLPEDQRIEFDDDFKIDVEPTGVQLVPTQALGAKFHLFANQLVHLKTTHVTKGTAYGSVTNTGAFTGTFTGNFNPVPPVGSWVCVGSDELYVMQVKTSTATEVQVASYSTFTGTVDTLWAVEGISSVAVPPHIVAVDANKTVAPHGSPSLSRSIGSTDEATCTGVFDVVCGAGTTHICSEPCSRKDLAAIFNTLEDVDVAYRFNDNTFSFSGTGTLVAPMANNVCSAASLAGIRGSMLLQHDPFVYASPIPLFSRTIPFGAYSPEAFRNAVNMALNPGKYTSDQIVDFRTSHGFAAKIRVLAGRYMDLNDALRAMCAAMTRGEAYQSDLLGSTHQPTGYHAKEAGHITRIVACERTSPNLLESTVNPNNAKRADFTLDFRQSPQLAWDLGLRDDLVQTSSNGQIEFTPRHARRKSTLGSEGTAGSLCDLFPTQQYPSLELELESRDDRWRLTATPAMGPPVTPSGSRTGNLRWLASGTKPKTVLVRSHKVFVEKDETDDTYTVSTCAPLGVQPGDVVRINGIEAHTLTCLVTQALPTTTVGGSDVRNDDTPSKRSQPVGTVTKTGTTIKGVGTSFVRDVLPGATVFIEDLGLFQVDGAQSISDEQLSVIETAGEGTGTMYLTSSVAAKPFATGFGNDGSATEVYTGTSVDDSDGYGIRSMNLVHDEHWSVRLPDLLLQRRLGLPEWTAPPPRTKAVVGNTRDFHFPSHVLLCLENLSPRKKTWTYVRAPDDESSGHLTVLAHVPLTGTYNRLEGMESIAFHDKVSLSSLRLSLRYPNFKLFPVGVETSFTFLVQKCVNTQSM